jgi:hypothetical protein
MILLTRRLHSSSRDDKVVDDNAEICGPGEPHRSRSLLGAVTKLLNTSHLSIFDMEIVVLRGMC